MKKPIFADWVRRGKVALLTATFLTTSLIFLACGPDPDPPDPPEPPPPQPKTVEQIVSEVGPSVVNIESSIGKGSGVLFDAEGYIVTNDHVVRESNSLEVHLSDKRQLTAKRIGTDTRMDLAVIKVEADDLKVADWGDSDKVKAGTDVVAIGNARGVENSATKGIISNLNVDVDNGKNIIRCLQTDAPVNPGNSGGALVNMQGEVIGINAMGRNDAESMNYAIPINDVRKIARQLIDKGYISYPYIGVNLVNEKTKSGVYFIRVTDIMPDSPAAKEGLQKDDIIVKINGVRVETVSKLREQLNISGIGSMVSIHIERGNGEGIIQIKLEELPKGYYTIDWS